MADTKEHKYPEHMKLKAVADQSQICGEFIEWLQGRGFALCEWVESGCEWVESGSYGRYILSMRLIEDHLADFFEIDRNKLEQEKRQMLEECRAMHEQSDESQP